MQPGNDGSDGDGDPGEETLTYSAHAVTRMQQRGISRETVEQVVRFGQSHPTHEARAYRLPKRRREELIRDGKISPQQGDRITGIEIIANEAHVITVQHVTR